MDNREKFDAFLTTLRFLPYKITQNLKRIYLDFNANKVLLTAYYKVPPSQIELELFDDICTNSDAHLPNFYVEGLTKLTSDYDVKEKHDFVVFSVYEDIIE